MRGAARLAGLAGALVLVACAGDEAPGAGSSGASGPAVVTVALGTPTVPTGARPTPPDVDAACALLDELFVTSSRVDGTELASMRASLPAVVDVLDRLEPVAPVEIADFVASAATSMREWERTVAEPAFVLDAGTFDRLSTDLAGAGEGLAGWVEANCPAATGAGARTDVTLWACLPPGATEEEITSLFDRVTVPIPGGTDVELVDGVVGLGRHADGIFVTLDAFAPPERVDELEVVLSEPPVATVVRGAGGC